MVPMLIQQFNSFEVGLILCSASPAAAQGEFQGDGRGGEPKAGPGPEGQVGYLHGAPYSGLYS